MIEAFVVRHDLVVCGTPPQAFAAFTERMGAFKPNEHNLLSSPIASTTFEPRVGGHIVDRVQLEHRHLDRHGPGWQAVRDGVADEQGWPLYLARYAGLLESP